MSRKTKFGKNWKKAKAQVQRIHTQIANARRDYLHKTTTTISKNHAMVCIEDLQVRNMSASAAGTIEAPGTNVRAKSGLNKSILDQGWFEFRRQLDYKTGVERRAPGRGAAAEHQPDLSVLRACRQGEPADASPVRVRGMRFRGKRRSGRRDQCFKGGTRPASLRRDFARWGVGPGTRRSDYSQSMLCA